jgi:peptidoglycan hydrolase-like protein with peptidoglycan-binding domain
VRNQVALSAPVTTSNGDQSYNTLRAPWYVRKLQEDLRELGFRLVNEPNGNFGIATEWSVRHFQAYAKMQHTAQEDLRSRATRYVERLSQAEIPEEHRYTGPVCGVLNERTRELLQHWLDNKWRCPVVVEAWNVNGSGERTTIHEQNDNLWSYDSGPTGNQQTGPFIYARDFTEYYPLPEGRNREDLIVLGRRRTYLTTSTGPVIDKPSHFWAQAELTATHLVGTGVRNLTAAQLSTFKAVRAVAEVECYGFFDSVNAYDRGFMSFGPCHWVLGFGDNDSDNGDAAVERGELCGYLSYLRSADEDAFDDAMEFFGVRAHQDWGTNGSAIYNSSQRKYAGSLALQQADETWAQMGLVQENYNMMRSWHWFYRFVMAGRTLEGFRRRVWHLARARIRDIRRSQWNGTNTPDAQTVADIPIAPAQRGSPQQTRPATIGDVFTSERCMALLLRWHVKRPNDIVSQGRAGARVRDALQRARTAQRTLSWNTSPTTWGAEHEQALLDGLLAEAPDTNDGNLVETLDQVNDWPNYTGRTGRNYALTATMVTALSTARGSFSMDDADLPPEAD